MSKFTATTSATNAAAFASILLLALAGLQGADAHGLMNNPPARNQYCGVITKPHEVDNGVAEYPECGTAFNYLGPDKKTKGYEFMSVLTHDVGLAGVSALPNHVCGFDAETFQFGATPWDAPMNWPTTTISPGRLEIEWDIFWGPHFDDTEEFRYWITKEDFVFDETRELTWDDFDSDAFCVLFYDDANPTANPDVTSNKGETWFRTYCDIPDRPGRHVIYGEWGRNQFTYERFHGCIDVVIEGGSNPTPTPPSPTQAPAPSPTQAPVPSPTEAPVTSENDPTVSPTFTPSTSPVSPPTAHQAGDCTVTVRDGNNQWFGGLDVGFTGSTAVLNFAGTGLDLASIPNDKLQGVFHNVVKSGSTMEITNPGWVSLNTLGFIGFGGPNAGLANFVAPTCITF